MRTLLVAPLLLLAACSEEGACNLVGDYAGTFTGDADGDITLAIVDGDGGTVIDVTLQNTDLTAAGSGSIDCEDGEFDLDLMLDDGTDLGTLEGTIDESGAGDGTWEFTASQFEGLSGTWSAE